jgi:hypothetical protein
MADPKVTVLMAAYNAEPYIAEAIESILDQSFENFELVVGDDGSTDRSRSIVESYKDRRIRIVGDSVNRGLFHIRNALLNAARGEYIAVLDSDDVARRDRFSVQTEFLDANPHIALLGSAFDLVNEAGAVIGFQAVPTTPAALRWKLHFGCPFGHSTVMYRRRAAIDAGGYGNYALAEDFDLWRRIARTNEVSNLGPALVQYRVHGSSALRRTPSAVQEQNILDIVAAGISESSGLPIDARVAKILSYDFLAPAPDEATLRAAFLALERCLKRNLQADDLPPAHRRELIGLALTDMENLGNRHPSWPSMGGVSTLRALTASHALHTFPGQSVKAAWRAVAPVCVRRTLGSLRRKLRVLST